MTQTQDEALEKEVPQEESEQPQPEGAQAEEAVEQPVSEDEQYQQLYEQFVRLQADFENFRKRSEAEKQQWINFGVEKALRELLPVMDNLERGTASLTENSDAKTLYQSFKLVYDGLLGGLGNAGLQPIEAVGQPFDPNFHEAVGQVDSDYPEDTVAVELQKGFMLGEKVIRPTMVQVSTGNGAPAPSPEVSSEASKQDSSQTPPANPFKQVN